MALVTTTSQTGGNLTQQARQMVATQLQRLLGWDKWCVDIVPTSSPPGPPNFARVPKSCSSVLS